MRQRTSATLKSILYKFWHGLLDKHEFSSSSLPSWWYLGEVLGTRWYAIIKEMKLNTPRPSWIAAATPIRAQRATRSQQQSLRLVMHQIGFFISLERLLPESRSLFPMSHLSIGDFHEGKMLVVGSCNMHIVLMHSQLRQATSLRQHSWWRNTPRLLGAARHTPAGN